MRNISIITPVFGKAALTNEFIQSVARYIEDDELIIVDNNSPDETLSVLKSAKKIYPNMKMKIYSDYRNRGFGSGNAIGSKIASNDILIFISNDVKILGDFISPIAKHLEQFPRRVIGPRLLSMGTGWNDCYCYKSDGGPVGVIPYIEGFLIGIRKEVYNMVGGWDTNFFCDMEDIDLSYRLHLAGIGLGQINLPVIHSLGGSFSNLNINRLDITLQSQKYFMDKWGFYKKNV